MQSKLLNIGVILSFAKSTKLMTARFGYTLNKNLAPLKKFSN